VKLNGGSKPKRVALIFGGEGCEHEISVRSAISLDGLIDKTRATVMPVYITRSGDWLAVSTPNDTCGEPTYPVRLNGRSGFLTRGGIIEVDVALPILHGSFGEDGIIQGALEAAHIKYVGAGVLAGAVSADKITTKILAESLNIPTARWVWCDAECADEARSLAEEKLTYPMFIKPSGSGSSYGVARVNTREEFAEAYLGARAHDVRVLIEECIDVDYEIECGYFSLGEPILSASGAVATCGETYDYERKYSPKGIKATHGEKSELRTVVADYARELAHLIGLRHVSRIDFLVDRRGQAYFNEINTIPGMTDTSLYPLLTEDMGMARGEFINRLIHAYDRRI